MGKIIGGAAQVAGSLIGGRQRRADQKNAQSNLNETENSLSNFQFQNYNKDLENVYEDQTVNQQQFNAQAQQNDAGLSQGLDAIVAGGGGGGSAQAIANAALQSKQGISQDIGRQEQSNQSNRLQAQAQLDTRTADAEFENQYNRHGQLQQQHGLQTKKLDAANAARQQATDQLVGGIGSIAGGVASNLTGGATGILGALTGK